MGDKNKIKVRNWFDVFRVHCAAPEFMAARPQATQVLLLIEDRRVEEIDRVVIAICRILAEWLVVLASPQLLWIRESMRWDTSFTWPPIRMCSDELLWPIKFATCSPNRHNKNPPAIFHFALFPRWNASEMCKKCKRQKTAFNSGLGKQDGEGERARRRTSKAQKIM